jgi:ParB family chromosome partitioning protein
MAQTTGLRVLKAIGDAVPVRLMKRDLLFVVERLAAVLDERRLAIVLRQHNLGKPTSTAEAPAKLLASFLRKSDEGTLGRLLVEVAILQTAHTQNDSSKALRDAADYYKVDVAAITSKVKQEYAAKTKAKATKEVAPKPPAKVVKKAVAA